MKIKKTGFLLGIVLVLNALLWYYFSSKSAKVVEKSVPARSCVAQGIRRTGFKYTKPIVLLNSSCDDPIFDELRSLIYSYLNDQKNAGNISNASVYVRLLDNGKYFILNEESYSPGSVMKIMTLMSYFKDAETNPSLLSEHRMFNGSRANMPVQAIPSAVRLVPGKEYTVMQLIEQMIRYSDNDATNLLNSRVSGATYNNILTALHLPVPEVHQLDYPLTAEEMSRFFRVLYNASFLSPQMSDRALELLTQSEYKEGIAKDMPQEIHIAHKFGERNHDGTQQLHEAGIFFAGNVDYVLVVMTKGNDVPKQQSVLSGVSKMVYDEIARMYKITFTGSPATTESLAKPSTGRSTL